MTYVTWPNISNIRNYNKKLIIYFHNLNILNNGKTESEYQDKDKNK
jgi:hypothetical protein